MKEALLLMDPVETGKQFCLQTLKVMLRSRLLDEKMNKLVRQNKGGTFFLSNAGHEMVGAVAALSLRPGTDWFFPYYRDRTLAIGLGTTSVEILQTAMGREGKHHSGGRMMPEHFSDRSKRIVCQSSVVGSQYLQAVGVAKSVQLAGKEEVVYVSGGDGSTSQGDFHEALNFAALHHLPIIFVIQHNDFAISVPCCEQTTGGDITSSIQSIPNLRVVTIDGCNFEQTSKAFQEAATRGKKGFGPSVIVAKVPRLGAHSNSDDPKKYLTEDEIAAAIEKDPLPRFAFWLEEMGLFSKDEYQQLREEIFSEIEQAAQEADRTPMQRAELADQKVFHASIPLQLDPHFGKEKEEIVMVDAINHAIDEEMKRDSSIVVFGQDVAHGKGGVFGVTKHLTEKYGVNRCFNTPLAESTIIGLAIGMSMAYHRPIAEIQFADYIWTGMNQLINGLASIHYRSNGEWSCPVVIRMPCGGYIQGGPYHSQNIEAYLAHTPGLKVIYPSNASDAKMLMKTAIYDPNPVVFLEHKGLYRQKAFCAKQEPEDHEWLELGKAFVAHEGTDLTLIGYGMMVVYALEIAQIVKKEGISIEVIDLRTISPWDEETVLNSVKKTGKALIVHEAAKTAGFGAEIAATLASKAFMYLDAPIRRIGAKNCPVPYAKELENAVLPQKEDILNAVRELASF